MAKHLQPSTDHDTRNVAAEIAEVLRTAERLLNLIVPESIFAYELGSLSRKFFTKISTGRLVSGNSTAAMAFENAYHERFKNLADKSKFRKLFNHLFLSSIEALRVYFSPDGNLLVEPVFLAWQAIAKNPELSKMLKALGQSGEDCLGNTKLASSNRTHQGRPVAQGFDDRKEIVGKDHQADSEQTLADISGPIQWAKQLGPDDSEQLRKLLTLTGAEVITYLMGEGHSQREIGRLLDLNKSRISQICRGEAEPLESFTKKILEFAVFLEN